MRNLNIALALAAVVVLAGSAGAVPFAEYDVMTGNITFRGFDGEIGGHIFSTGGNLDGANAPPASVDLAVDVTEAPLEIAIANFSGLIGEYDIGDVAAPGLPTGDLSFQYVFVGRFGIGFGDGDVIRVNEVPEPSNVTLLGLCLTGLWGTRRRNG